MPISDAEFAARVEHLRATLQNQSQGGLIIEERTATLLEGQQADFLQRHFPLAIYPLFEVSAELASNILRELWRESTAYDIEMMSADQAQTLASQFLALFGSNVRCWSNRDLPHTDRQKAENGTVFRLGDSLPLTSATFNGGVLVLGTRHVGVLWFEDED